MFYLLTIAMQQSGIRKERLKQLLITNIEIIWNQINTIKTMYYIVVDVYLI